MKYVKLGNSDLSVSEVCLGTMTWGQQNTQKQAHEQIEYALNKGVNFMDTAEMYPIPPKAKTQGSTERYIGEWFAKDAGNREKVVLASKMTGPGLSWIRDGSAMTGASLKQAVEGSLSRLQTDYIDLYQLHWPNRTSPHFAKNWPDRLSFAGVDAQQQRDGMLELLQALDACVKEGKIRYCGLSNETPWGINEYLDLSKEHDLPAIVSIQNEFNLLHIKDFPYLIEECVMKNVGYLAWSPLSTGILSGKYRNGDKPEGSRWTMLQRNGLFRDTPRTHQAVDALLEVANDHDLTLTQLSLAWVYQFHGVTSTIIGATKLSQLKEDIAAHAIELTEQAQADINAVLRAIPMPY